MQSFGLQSTSGDGSLGPENNNAAALPLEHRSGGGYDVGLPLPSGGPLQGPHDDTWPLQAVPDAVKIKHLQVQCEKTHMRVNIEFDRPFYGVIFSKGACNITVTILYYCSAVRGVRGISTICSRDGRGCTGDGREI